ncbi:putative 1-acyl-sn-glycerol-3-phosphate acyltransferase 5 [Asimina triloba]
MNGSAVGVCNAASHKSMKSMEVCRPPNDGPQHRPLTPFRVLQGVLCLVVLLSTAFMSLVYWAPVTTFLVRLFSIRYSRKATSILFGSWLALWPFLFEKINQTKVVCSGETVPAKERVLLIANHRTEVDWMYLWDLALRKGCLGYLKYILKSSLMKLPIFGWGFHILEFISVERKWEIDEPVMRQMLSTFVDSQDPLWLAVFPEGTDFTEQKCIQSQKFAAENGLPILKNVLLPKTKGFLACVEVLRHSLDAVYDVTFGYKHRCPYFMDNVFGVDPSEVHVHVQRIPLTEIPTDENEAAAWLMEAFRLKDELLSNFRAQGHFPDEGTEGELPTWKCLANSMVVITLTSTLAYLTFFSSVWFKVYVACSCMYLAIATHFNLRPSPNLDSVARFFTSSDKKSK